MGAHKLAACRHSIAAVKSIPFFSSFRALQRKLSACRRTVVFNHDRCLNAFPIDGLLQKTSCDKNRDWRAFIPLIPLGRNPQERIAAAVNEAYRTVCVRE
jgi:hypothetical protein